MAGVTTLSFFNTRQDAENEAYLLRGAGMSVVLIGPSDIVQTSGQALSKIEWNSGDAVNWYLVLSTEDKVAVGGQFTDLP